jgi:orotate phosphoribosyltransferase-like protein
MPVTALIVDSGSIPVYLEIGEKAAHLREFGMSDKAIARALNVSEKTVAKAIHLGASDK